MSDSEVSLPTCPEGCAVFAATQCEQFDTVVTCTDGLRYGFAAVQFIHALLSAILLMYSLKLLVRFRENGTGLTTKVKGQILVAMFSGAGFFEGVLSTCLWLSTPPQDLMPGTGLATSLLLATVNSSLFVLVVYVVLFWYRLALISGNDFRNLNQRVHRRKVLATLLMCVLLLSEWVYRIWDGIGEDVPLIFFVIYNVIILIYISCVNVSSLVLGLKVYKRNKFGRQQRKAQRRASMTLDRGKTQQEYTSELTVVVLVLAVAVIVATVISLVYVGYSILSGYKPYIHLTYIFTINTLRYIGAASESYTLRPMKIYEARNRGKSQASASPSSVQATPMVNAQSFGADTTEQSDSSTPVASPRTRPSEAPIANGGEVDGDSSSSAHASDVEVDATKAGKVEGDVEGNAGRNDAGGNDARDAV